MTTADEARTELADVLVQHPWLAYGWPNGFCPMCNKVIKAGHNSPAYAQHLADALIAAGYRKVEVTAPMPLEDVIEGVYNHGGLKAIIAHERSEGSYCCEVGCGSGACETCPCCSAGSCVAGVEVTDDMVERAAAGMYFEDCGNTPDARERATDEFDAQFRQMARAALTAALGGGDHAE